MIFIKDVTIRAHNLCHSIALINYELIFKMFCKNTNVEEPQLTLAQCFQEFS